MSFSAEKLRVLIVDDVTSARRVVARVLVQLGIKQVSEAKSGAEALALLRSNTFHLIISDWQMPDVNGVELLRQVRAESAFEKIPFIMLTSESDREQVKVAAQAGVTDYIIKPVSLHTLAEKIRAAFADLAAKTSEDKQ